VSIDVTRNTWLVALIDEALAGYDPAAALLHLPPELRSADPEGPGLEARARALLVRSLRRGKLLEPPPPDRANATPPAAPDEEDAFLGPVQGHVGLALDIALIHGVAFDTDRRRAELATLFAALVGAFDLARAADPRGPGGGAPAAVHKALARAGAELKARGFPAADPTHGLSLRVGRLCIQRRHLARLAIAFHRDGHLDVAGARKLFDRASSEVLLLVQALAALASAPAQLDDRERRVALAQVARLGLPRELARQARSALKTPPSAAELAHAAPLRLRAFLLEQLLLAELAAEQPSPPHARFIQTFADAARIPPDQVAALQANAAELAAQQRWFDPSAEGVEEWAEVASEWEEVADEMLDKVATTVTDNLGAILTEIRQTGELGQLLAKAAAGSPLTRDEKARVKEQLLDLAKAVPALAIFAAPGGMLLLPLLAKLLPFDLLPSAWNHKPRAKGASGDAHRQSAEHGEDEDEDEDELGSGGDACS
jgi:hypothetical protein